MFIPLCPSCAQNLDDLGSRCWNCEFEIYPAIAIHDQAFLQATAVSYRSALAILGENLTKYYTNNDPFTRRYRDLQAIPTNWANEKTVDFVRWGPEIYLYLQESVRGPTQAEIEASSRLFSDFVNEVFEAILLSYSHRFEMCRSALEADESVVNNRARHANAIIEHSFHTIAEIRRATELICASLKIDAARSKAVKLVASANEQFHPGFFKRKTNQVFRFGKGTVEFATGLAIFTVAAAAALTVVGAKVALKFGAIDLPIDFPQIDLSSSDLSPGTNDLIASLISDPLNQVIDKAEDAIKEAAVDEIAGRLAAIMAIAPLGSGHAPEEIPRRVMGLTQDYVRCVDDIQKQIHLSTRQLLNALSWDLTLLRTNELSLLREAAIAGVSISTLGLADHSFLERLGQHPLNAKGQIG